MLLARRGEARRRRPWFWCQERGPDQARRQVLARVSLMIVDSFRASISHVCQPQPLLHLCICHDFNRGPSYSLLVRPHPLLCPLFLHFTVLGAHQTFLLDQPPRYHASRNPPPGRGACTRRSSRQPGLRSRHQEGRRNLQVPGRLRGGLQDHQHHQQQARQRIRGQRLQCSTIHSSGCQVVWLQGHSRHLVGLLEIPGKALSTS